MLHALVISAIRLKYPDFAGNEAAADIEDLTDAQLKEVKDVILDRPEHYQACRTVADAENEIDQFIDWWKVLTHDQKSLRYYVYRTDRYNRLMNYYSENCTDIEKATLSSMREVENAANMYYYTED